MNKIQLTYILLLIFAFNTNAFPETKLVQKIKCVDQVHLAKGEESGLTIIINLSKPINPAKGYKIYNLTGNIALNFRRDIADNFGIKSKILRKNLYFSKEPAMYSHELGTSWLEESSDLIDDTAKLSLFPILDNNQNFTNKWIADFYYPVGEFGLELSGYVRDQNTLEDTTIPKLLCQRVY